MENNELSFDEFSPVSKEEWLAKLEKDLKGKPMEDLNWFLGNDMVVPPFYHQEDADENWHPLSSNGLNNDWEICEEIIVREIKEANQLAIKALEGGANALRFNVDEASIRYDALEELLENINLEYISVHFYFNQDYLLDVIKNFFTILGSRHCPHLQGSFNFDFGEENSFNTWDDDMRLYLKFMPNFKLITVNGGDLPVGAEDATQTLATLLKRGNALFQAFLNDGFSKEDIQNQIQFSIPIGKSYFVEIAKIRALKMLWANVLAGYEVENIIAPTIEAHFSKSELTDDVNTNMIHATTQAMSAVIGGVNRLTVLPADKKGTAFTKRIARNVQHLLKMESFMDRVHDPAAGSYYIEKLTEQLSDKAWEIFQND